jgi:hypothetical protein
MGYCPKKFRILRLRLAPQSNNRGEARPVASHRARLYPQKINRFEFLEKILFDML